MIPVGDAIDVVPDLNHVSALAKVLDLTVDLTVDKLCTLFERSVRKPSPPRAVQDVFPFVLWIGRLWGQIRSLATSSHLKVRQHRTFASGCMPIWQYCRA